MSICSQFFGPSRMALIGDIVPVEERPRAISLLSLSFNIGLLLGEALAAPLYVVGGVRWALLFDALSFLLSFAAIFLLHAPEAAYSLKRAEQPHFWRELRAGFRISVVNKVLLVVLVTGILVSLGTGAFNALYLLFGIRNLHTPTALLGLYGATYGVGVIAGLPVAAWLTRRMNEARLLWAALLTYGLGMLIAARMINVIVGLILFFLLGFVNAGINVCVQPLMLRVTPRELIGRVQAVNGPLITASSLLSQTLAGLLASTLLDHLHTSMLGTIFGPLDTIFTGTGLLVLSAGIYAFLSLRNVSLVEGQTDRH